MNRRKFIQNCSLGSFGLMAAPVCVGGSANFEADDQSITKVYLIFKTHLDIGFTDLAANVIKTYMQDFIPAALSLSEDLRKNQAKDRFVWTTGSWLIYQYLEKADAVMRRRMENAIGQGDISWHGLPFTLHSELADPSLFDLGLQLCSRLDQRFNTKTIAAKMTDVPGHTRSIVPLLAKNGIKFLHIGVNPASMPPDVPPLFVWRAPDGSDIVVMYQKDYGSQMLLPDNKTVVAIQFTSDNHGPQTPGEIVRIYNGLRTRYPNAEIVASTLNAVAGHISGLRRSLPVITQELGDTWIHGVGSDPLKIAQLREMSRLRAGWLNNKSLQLGDKTDLAFGLPLLMIAEHTWGLDVKTFLKDWDIYAPRDFHAARSKPNFKLMEHSWNEKRQYVEDAITGLPDDKATEARLKLQALKPVEYDYTGYEKIASVGNLLDTQFFELKIDSQTGCITKLKDKTSGIDWAGKNNPLCLFSYQTFSGADYERYQGQYLTQKSSWALGDFGKTGQESGHAISRTWLPAMKEAFIKKDQRGTDLLIRLDVSDEKGDPVGGCPGNISVGLFFAHDRKEVEVTLQLLDKPANRLPEASWFSFIPPVEYGAWILDKMGQEVEAIDVVKNGNRALHAIRNGIRFENGMNQCSIESPDAPLVAVGERNLLNFDNHLPDVKEGVHFCLHNNVWGTNFVMWFDQDMKYRFTLKPSELKKM